jgi:radial spoke head protein 9
VGKGAALNVLAGQAYPHPFLRGKSGGVFKHGKDEEGNPKPAKPRFSEAVRLAATVAAIEHDTGVVPGGAYTVTPTHHVVPNPGFGGLSASEAGSLGSYAHFRRAEHPSRAGAL